MNKETRIVKIQESMRSQEPFGKQEIYWLDQLSSMNAYKIPLEYLVYNKYNGRILSRTKSLESQKQEIDVESQEGKKTIEDLLWNSNLPRNKQTLDSLKIYGQEKVGIITKDGIIIDGNRRAMLLNMIGDKDYFKTIVLDITLEENPLEIEKLETSFQMGEDEKLGYNPIEKYIKVKGLRQKNIEVEKIAKWMGEDESKINDYINTMKIMDEYLEYLDYSGIYTQLDLREDHLINLTKWTKNFYGEQSSKAFDGYKDSDVDDLKNISFDYIRAIYEGKEFRFIAEGLQGSHFFGNKAIWQEFSKYHFSHMDLIKDKEGSIDYDSQNLVAHLKDRDAKYSKYTEDENGKSFLEENMSINKQKLYYKKNADRPLKLANDAFEAIEAIDQRLKSFSDPEVINRINELNQKTVDILGEKSPKRLLSQVVLMLNSIDIDSDILSEEGVLEELKAIQKIVYKLEKGI